MSHKPRLLILITLAEAGGAQTAVSSLLPGLTGEFDVTVAAHGSGPLRDAARAAGVPLPLSPMCPSASSPSTAGRSLRTEASRDACISGWSAACAD